MKTQRRNRTFYGHGTTTIIINIFVALIAPLLMYGTFKWILSEHSMIAIVFALVEFAIFAPFVLASPSYLCFELKHVLFRDGIADTSRIGQSAFFIMSLVGYLSGVLTIKIIVEVIPFLNNAYMILEVIVLSFASAYGGAIGLCDGVPTDLFIYPKYFLKDVVHILTGKLIWVVLLMAVLLTLGVWASSQIVTIH